MIDGNAEQIRYVAEQLADATVARLERRFESGADRNASRQPAAMEWPAPIKWAAGIIAGVISLSAGAGLLWMVNTVNDVQLTLTRLEATLSVRDEMAKDKQEEVTRRIKDLEAANGEAR